MKQIDEAAANLIKLSEKIDKEKMNSPSFLMVLTGGQVAYKRPDGVLVVPIGCLKDKVLMKISFFRAVCF